MAKLIIQFQNSTRGFELKPGRNTLGRSKKCNIFIEDNNLSREHCCFLVGNDSCTVQDLGSMNGTHVNGRKLDKEQALRVGDVVRVGSVTVHYESKRAAARQAPTRSRTAAGVRRGRPVKDYSLWHAPRFGRIAARVGIAALLVVLGAGGWLAVKFLIPSGPAADPGNLLTVNPSFEDEASGAAPPGWGLVVGSETVLQVESGSAHHGQRFLSVQKSGADDFTIEIAANSDPVVLPSDGAGLEVSAWVRFDSFEDHVALKVAWLARPGGFPILEAISPPLSGGSEWTELRRSFRAPPRCGLARISLVAVGRPGTFLVDAVRAEALPDYALEFNAVGDYAFGVSSSGSLLVRRDTRLLLANVHARTTVASRGTAAQVPGTRCTVRAEGEGWVVEGDMVTPSETDPVSRWKAHVRPEDGGLRVVTGFDPDVRAALDRIELELTLPDARLISPQQSSHGSRIEFMRAGERYRLEFPFSVKIELEEIEGDVRVMTVWGQGTAVGDAATSFLLIPTDLDRVEELKRMEREVTEAHEAERWGAEADALRALADRVDDPKRSDALEKDLAAVRARERRAYRAAQLAISEAILSQDARLRAAALEALGDYRMRFDGAFFTEHLQALSEAANNLPADDVADGATPAAVLLRRARKYQVWEMAALTEVVLRAIIDRYPGSPEAGEAESMLAEGE